MKHTFFSIIACAIISLFPVVSHAQIGYQVSLLNTATGEPRAGVTVNATVTITDSSDKVIYTGTQQATTNDFGVLSLTVGNADTFSKADFGKLPFFISVSVDGALIGKSQILSVPVAEYAKRTGELTVEKLVGTWKCNDRGIIYSHTFSANGTYEYTYDSLESKEGFVGGHTNGTYNINGNSIWMESINEYDGTPDFFLLYYNPSKNTLGMEVNGQIYTKQ